MKQPVTMSRLLSILAGALLASTAVAASGPDVIVGDLPDFTTWGVYNGIAAFSIGTTSCNIGNTVLRWESANNHHPVIGQNLYRWKSVNGAGHFEMIGQSWLKHGFTALNGTVCGSCTNPDGTGATLDPTCSDPYSSSLNGSQARLGPKSQVNAFTGYYPYPVTGIQPVPTDGSAVIARRLQVAVNDVTPSLNTGAIYFAEGHYIADDDIAAGNGLNNASYRRVSITGTSPNFVIAPTGTYTTQRGSSGINAWGSAELGVTYRSITVPGEGTFTLACKATHLANGQWHYEYALHNMNSDRCGASFSINLQQSGAPDQIQFTNVGFTGVPYHSGEPYASSPWTTSRSGESFGWSVVGTYATNANANALRWGTMYSFRFDSDQAPIGTGTATLGLFKPGSPNTMLITGVVIPGSPPCIGDFDKNGGVDGTDIGEFFYAWENGMGASDSDQNGGIDGGDVEMFITHWVAGC